MYPHQRGAASSLQAFTSLVSNALIAGVLSPWLSRVPLHLALGTAAFAFMGWAFWRWEMYVVGQRIPDAHVRMPVAVEPTDRM
jgi:DHA1 family bicyclomycin/chloramphenicol resistance-like MFS transporter